MTINPVVFSSVSFSFVESEARYKAKFFKDGELKDWKYLTPVEVDGLEGWLPTEGQNVMVDALGLYEELDNMWFDTADGVPTNFEQMLFDLVQDEIDE